jgi:predicted enzyme related to lactoylglutathione lyase
MESSFGFTKLVVGDLEGMSAFYQQAYGLKPFDRVKADIAGEAIDEIMLGRDSAFGPGSVVLLQYPDKPAPQPGAVILGFTTDDLDALVARVQSAGGTLHGEVKISEAAPVRVAFLYDPEGNLAECVQVIGDI